MASKNGKTSPAERYPQHEKLGQVQKESHAIGEFLDWLMNVRKPAAVIAEWSEPRNPWDAVLVPISASIQELLAEYFGIDREQLEAEKNRMLRELQDRLQPKKDTSA